MINEGSTPELHPAVIYESSAPELHPGVIHESSNTHFPQLCWEDHPRGVTELGVWLAAA